MPSKKELTREELELYNELKKLSKRANQRIVRLERAFRERYLGYKIFKNQACNRTVASLDTFWACTCK